MQNLKPLASLYSWAGQFGSYLVANREDRFSYNEAHFTVLIWGWATILQVSKREPAAHLSVAGIWTVFRAEIINKKQPSDNRRQNLIRSFRCSQKLYRYSHSFLCHENRTPEKIAVWVIILKFEYRKNPKYSDNRQFCCNPSKIWTRWLSHRVMRPKDADGIANSVDPDQTAPSDCFVLGL